MSIINWKGGKRLIVCHRDFLCHALEFIPEKGGIAGSVWF